MMEQNDLNNCQTCGRAWLPIEPKCPTFDGCDCEYCGRMPACIKSQQTGCLAKAVIPSVTVETIDGITSLANCFVHVININTTFYVDDKHRVMITWAGPVEVNEYDIEANALGLRSQTCYTTVDGVYAEVYFDKQGVGHVMAKEV